jgi:hypothetical protein
MIGILFRVRSSKQGRAAKFAVLSRSPLLGAVGSCSPLSLNELHGSRAHRYIPHHQHTLHRPDPRRHFLHTRLTEMLWRLDVQHVVARAKQNFDEPSILPSKTEIGRSPIHRERAIFTYSTKEKRAPSYGCVAAYQDGGASTCQMLSSAPVDAAVTERFLTAVTPAEMEIALHALDEYEAEPDGTPP